MELTTYHKIYYSNKQAVPVENIAESLLALEKIIKSTSPILENLFPGVTISHINVFIDRLESGSLWEDIIVKFIFGSQEDFDAFIASSRKKISMDELKENNKLLSAIILAAVLAGGAYALSKVPSDPKNTTTIEANNNVIINIGAGMVEMRPEEFRSVIETSIKSKKDLAKNAIKFVNPAKREESTAIEFDESDQIRLNPDTIGSFPSYIPDEADEEVLKDFHNTKVIVRATDLNNLKRGWAVIVPEVSEKRIQLQLDDNISPVYMAKKAYVYGDVTILFKIDENGAHVPKKV